VENARDNVVKRCRKDTEASLNQEREDIDSDVHNQSSSSVPVVKKIVGERGKSLRQRYWKASETQSSELEQIRKS
jgi:hypothetical protein